MAEVKFSGLIQGLRGSLGKESPYYLRKDSRTGKTYMCVKPGATPDMIAGIVPYKRPKPTVKPSPAMLTQRERFTELQRAASEIMNAPTLRKYFENKYSSAKPRCTLRNYIMKYISKL